MKTLYTTVAMILLLTITLSAQTTDEIPGPERVLVVYELPTEEDSTSFKIKNYYVQKRNIPASNELGIEIPNPADHGCSWGLYGEEEIIGTASKIAGWNFVKQFIADEIEQHLNTTYYDGQLLKDVIRYIVLCKGIPLKVRYSNALGWDGYAYTRNRVSVDALLCLINQPTGWSFTYLFERDYDDYENPYYDVDPRFTMDYRFISNYFVNQEGWYLQYLVSRLDGDDLGDVIALIDRSFDPDMSGDKYWIIDDDPEPDNPNIPPNLLEETHLRLNYLDFNLNPEVYVSENEWIWNNELYGNEEVIGYISYGTHAPMPTLYILDNLEFDYANGAIFSSIESFNGFSFGETRAGHGLVSDFINMGGTGGVGTVYEPFLPGGGQDELIFPAYSLGYSLVEAIYQGIKWTAWQNTVVGDPLTRIYECQNTVISTNTTIGSTDYNCDVTVPPGVTLTIASGSTVNFNKNCELKLFGNLVLNESAILNFRGYSTLDLQGNLIANGSIAYLNFNHRSIFDLKSLQDLSNLLLTFNDESEFILPENLVVDLSSDNQMIFNDKSKFLVKGTLNINENGTLYFNDETNFGINGTLNVNENSSLNFSGSSVLWVGVSTNSSMNIYAGAILNFNDDSYLNAAGDFICQGESLNNVIFNFTNSPVEQFVYSGSNSLIIDNTIFNGGELAVRLAANQPVPENLSITNSTFRDCQKAIIFDLGSRVPVSTPLVSNCNIVNCTGVGIELNKVVEILIEHCTIEMDPNAGGTRGIILFNDGIINIADCSITDADIGITSYSAEGEDLDETLLTEIDINQCILETALGISLNGQNFRFNSININDNHFETEGNGIVINDFSNFTLNISENVMIGYSSGGSEFGISLTNGNEVVITDNSITNFNTGIYLGIVTNPYIVDNNISAIDLTVAPGSGIFAESCNGEIRKNTIQYHSYGIELGGSSPNVAENTITSNDYYGIYISGNSNPDLGSTLINETEYPLTGYNEIRENGICTWPIGYAEIYIDRSSIKLSRGCNTIADDRENDLGEGCDYTILMDGYRVDEYLIYADSNYWGDHPVYGNDPSQRFGAGIEVVYEPFLTEPCTFSQGEGFLVMTDSKGGIIDTVYSSGTAPANLPDLESRYAAANSFYYTKDYSSAIQEYQQIIQNYGVSISSVKAYNKLYTIEKLVSSTGQTFTQLRNFYQQKLSTLTDSILIGTLNHLSHLCLVAESQYQDAISEFDDIVQNNPNTDLALYGEIDALTTALLLPPDSTLGKGTLGKYVVGDISDYTNRVSQLLKNRGKSGTETERENIPDQYYLYQNYPNPFNPITTIKYDLPSAENVKLVVYDILGRRVKTLINEKKEAGRYEVNWNASNFASGIYIYQLRAGDYVDTKKMILLK